MSDVHSRKTISYRNAAMPQRRVLIPTLLRLPGYGTATETLRFKVIRQASEICARVFS